MIIVEFFKRDAQTNSETGLGSVVQVLTSGLSGISRAELEQIKIDAQNSANSANSSATAANISASEAADSLVDVTALTLTAVAAKDDAIVAKNTATTQAGVATSQAGIATTQADIATVKAAEATAAKNSASTSANTATTKATEAANSAAGASADASAALTYKTDAVAAASTATSKASIATTKATEASISAAEAVAAAESTAIDVTTTNNNASAASSAASSANSAASGVIGARDAAIAARDAAEAAETGTQLAKIEAETARDSAIASATTATTKASEATTKAAQAATSATNASIQATAAGASATTATTKATEAANSVTTATTKATEATNSAANASASEIASASSAVKAKTEADRAQSIADNMGGGGGGTWGSITGTLSSQTDLQGALDAKLALNGNAVSASKLQTARTISLAGDATGSITFDGSADKVLTITLTGGGGGGTWGSITGDIANQTDLQTALTGKLSTTGIAASAVKLSTARTISLSGDVTGSTSFDGSGNVTITTVVANDSHTHTWGNIVGKPTEFNPALTGNLLTAVPVGAVFTDTNTWRGITDSVSTTSSTISASATAVKAAYDQAADKAPLVHTHSNQYMGVNYLNGYRGMLGHNESLTDWVRTTTSGIIPSTSGSNGSLGTSSWRFSTAYIDNVYGTLQGNATTASTLQTARTINGVSFNGSSNITVYDSTKFANLLSTITSGDWNSILTQGAYPVANMSGANRPDGYAYGLALNFSSSAATSGVKTQIYFPHNASDTGNTSDAHLPRYRSGYNTDFGTWKVLASTSWTISNFLSKTGGTLTGNLTLANTESLIVGDGRSSISGSGPSAVFTSIGNITIQADDDLASPTEYLNLNAGSNSLKVKGGSALSSGLTFNGGTVYHSGYNNIGTGATNYAAGNHTHDDRYFTESETRNLAYFTGNDSTVSYGRQGIQYSNFSGVGGTGANGAQLKNPHSDWYYHITSNHANSGGYYADIALCFHSDTFAIRRVAAGVDYGFRTLLHSGNYNSYSPTLTGGGASGTWGISISGNASTATWADTVDVNASNASNSDYQVVWHSGDTLYSSSKSVTINPYAGRVKAAEFRGNNNVGGTGEAIYCPAGVYSQGTNWLYGLIITSNNSIDAGTGAITCGTLTASGAIAANAGITQDGHTIFNGSDTWMRTTGATGWYNAQYGGGIYQTDSTYVKIYASKGFQVDEAGHSAIYVAGGVRVAGTSNYGLGITGLYSATRFQGVFAMGTAYQLGADGVSPGNLYGIAWTHSNNTNAQGRVISGHHACFMTNGVTKSAIGDSIWTAGTVTGTDCIATSDIRVKTNIKQIVDPLGKLSKLTGNTFNRLDMGGRIHAGVIAQEVQKVLPEAIFEHSDAALGTKLTVSTSAMIGLLVAGTNALQKENTELKNRLDSLEELVYNLSKAIKER